MFTSFLTANAAIRSRLVIATGGLAFASGSLLVLVPLATGAAEVLSLEGALQVAEARAQRLVAQGAVLAAARDMAVAAGERPDPVLSVGVLNLPINTVDRFSLTRDSMTMRAVGITQELTGQDKRSARAARYDREADLAYAARSAALADLRRDTALAWLNRYYLERQRALLDGQRAEARLQVETSETLYRGARGTQADVFATRSAMAQLDDRIAQLDRQVASSRVQLARWIGEAASTQLATLPAIERPPLRSADLDAQLQALPQLTVLAKQEQVAQAESRVAQADRKADWTVEVMYGKRGPTYSDMVSVNFSIPLQWDQKNRQDRQLAAKLAQAEQRRAELEEATRERRAELEALLQEWQSDRERLARYDDSLVPLADERTRAAVAAYRGGASPIGPVLEARRAAIEMRLDRIRLEWEAARLWAQLAFLNSGVASGSRS